MFGMKKENLITEQYAVLRYDGISSSLLPLESAPPPSQDKSLTVLDPNTLRPLIAMTAPASTEQETLEVSFGLTSNRIFRSYINGSSWENEGLNRKATLYDLYQARKTHQKFKSEEFMITKPSYAVLDLIINNLDEGDHALHVSSSRHDNKNCSLIDVNSCTAIPPLFLEKEPASISILCILNGENHST